MNITNLETGNSVALGKAALLVVSNIMAFLRENNEDFSLNSLSKSIGCNPNTTRLYFEALKGLKIISVEYGDKGIIKKASILTEKFKIESDVKSNFIRTKAQSNSLLALYAEFGMPYTDNDSDSLEDTLEGFRKFVETHGSNLTSIKQQLQELDILKDVYVNDRTYELYKESFVFIDGKWISADEYLAEIEEKIPASGMESYYHDNRYSRIEENNLQKERKLAREPLFYWKSEIVEEDSPALTEEEASTIELLSQQGVIYTPRKVRSLKHSKVTYSV